MKFLFFGLLYLKDLSHQTMGLFAFSAKMGLWGLPVENQKIRLLNPRAVNVGERTGKNYWGRADMATWRHVFHSP